MLRTAFFWLPLLLLFAAWVQPLHITPWTSFHSEVLVFLAVAVAAVYAILSKAFWARKRVEIPLLAVLSLLFSLLAALQWAVGLLPYGGDAVVVGLYGAFGAMAATLGHHVLHPSEEGREYACADAGPLLGVFAIAILGAAILSVMIALLQTLELWLPLESIVRNSSLRRPGANFGQPNHLATFLLFGIAALTYLYLSQPLSPRLVAGCYCILLLGLALTESRTGAVSLAIFGVWFLYGQSPGGRSHTRRWVLLAGAYYGALLLVWPYLHALLMNPGGGEALQGINTAAGSRLTVWPQLWHAALMKPWFGWGLRNISAAHNVVLHLYSFAEPFTYSHNVVLDLVIGIGLPSAVLFLAFSIYAFQKVLRRRRTNTSWFALALALALMVHSMLEFPYAYAYFLFPVLFVAGSLQAAWPRAPRLVIPHALAAILVLATLWLGALVVKEYMAIEEDFRVARFKALNVGQVPDNYARPEIQILTQLDAMVVATNTVPKSGMSAEELQALRNAAQRFPWVAIQNRYALSLSLNGQREEAIRQLKVMRAMHGERVFRALQQDWEAKAAKGAEQLKGVANF